MAYPAIMAAGFVIKGAAEYEMGMDVADAEERNAAYYREQAEYAKKVGERQRDVFDRETDILFGEQQSAFARAGVDAANSAMFLSAELVSRQQESGAIKIEADQNVRLALLRAENADRAAKAARKGAKLGLVSNFIGAGAAYAGD